MKKNVLSLVMLVVIFSIPCLLSAQQIKIGVKAGASIPNLHDSGTNEISADYKSKVAENFGIVADIGISEMFSIKTGVEYAGQGGVRNGLQPIPPNILLDKLGGVQELVPPALLTQINQFISSGNFVYANFDNEASLNYIEVPLMGKVEWGKNIKYYVNAGPYIGFLLNAEQKTSGNSSLYLDKDGSMPIAIGEQIMPEQSMDATTDVKENLNSTNYGITGGVGLSYELGRKSAVVFDVRAAYGLTNIQVNSENGESKTGGLFITLGYLFSLN